MAATPGTRATLKGRCSGSQGSKAHRGGRRRGRARGSGRTRKGSHPTLAHSESASVAVKPLSVTVEAMRFDCVSTSLSLSLSLFAVTSTVTAPL